MLEYTVKWWIYSCNVIIQNLALSHIVQVYKNRSHCRPFSPHIKKENQKYHKNIILFMKRVLLVKTFDDRCIFNMNKFTQSFYRL